MPRLKEYPVLISIL